MVNNLPAESKDFFLFLNIICMKKFQIAIIWSAWAEEYPEWSLEFEKLYEMSYQAWYLLAEKWCFVLTGGKSGIMLWASKWCRDAWGISIGFVKWSQRFVSNEYVDIEIVTNMWDGWDAFLIPYSADGAIVIGGGVGTLKEIAWFYLQWKPIIILEKTGWWAEKLKDQYLDERNIIKTISANTPKEAVQILLVKLL